MRSQRSPRVRVHAVEKIAMKARLEIGSATILDRS